MTSYSDRDHDRADLRQAYEMGRKDARRARRRHPLLMTLLFVAAAVGVVLVALAVVNGSFGDAGVVVDQNLATAADKAEPAVRDAAAEASAAVRQATDNDGTNSAVSSAN
ncbi:hypothetical protein [Phenylobacterium kunshanense]|uniref:Uncharacterized protein n=1 Tax=Phenylobacterium kunshanense TaxID=1445034 RepID=A0A328BGF0_9CAUL|nr:hypothetical protein [Phenylobacterium kunshanense]RAK64986.1 hypothetical protein DJ019_13355 [Phenylobacterium kunshanense]